MDHETNSVWWYGSWNTPSLSDHPLPLAENNQKMIKKSVFLVNILILGFAAKNGAIYWLMVMGYGELVGLLHLYLHKWVQSGANSTSVEHFHCGISDRSVKAAQQDSHQEIFLKTSKKSEF